MAATNTKAKPDWQAIELEFVNSSLTFDELAEKHNVKPGTVRARASRGKWGEKRSKSQQSVTEAAQEKIAKTRTQELEKLDRNALKLAHAAHALAAKALTSIDQGKKLKYSPSDLKAILNVTNEAHKMGRLALGATTDNTGFSAPDGGPVKAKAELSIEQFATVAKQVADAV